MTEPSPSFFGRISLACGTFFAILSDAEFAACVRRLRQGKLVPEVKPAPRPPRDTTPDVALQLLGLLQREARFVDFVEEDITGYSDADVGVAARLVHGGCRKVLHEHFTLQPVREEAEGSRVSLNDDFDAAAIRLTGNVVGQAPFRGSLTHRGWRVTEVRLPRLAETHDARVIAPAEVEL